MKTKITYHSEGDYLIPDLVPPEEPRIGVWGRRRKWYLQHHRDPIYTGLLLSGKLREHLEEIDRSAAEMADRLMVQMARRDGITEELKSENQMEWVRRMNCCRKTVEEIIREELIFE